MIHFFFFTILGVAECGTLHCTLGTYLYSSLFLYQILCIFTLTLQDITKRGESFIMPGRSGHHTKVEFRFVVFRPFMEEILVGKVKSCNKEHVQGIYSYFK